MVVEISSVFRGIALFLRIVADLLDFVGQASDLLGATISFEFIAIVFALLVFKKGSWVFVLLTISVIIWIEFGTNEEKHVGLDFITTIRQHFNNSFERPNRTSLTTKSTILNALPG